MAWYAGRNWNRGGARGAHRRSPADRRRPRIDPHRRQGGRRARRRGDNRQRPRVHRAPRAGAWTSPSPRTRARPLGLLLRAPASPRPPTTRSRVWNGAAASTRACSPPAGSPTPARPAWTRARPFGLHGRVANAAAENLCIDQDWEGDEFVIRLKGTMREAEAMVENLTLTRRIETRLGADGFPHPRHGGKPRIQRAASHAAVPLQFRLPPSGPRRRSSARSQKTEPRDEEARKDRGVEECLTFPEPVQGYAEKVFFHTLGARRGRHDLHRAA